MGILTTYIYIFSLTLLFLRKMPKFFFSFLLFFSWFIPPSFFLTATPPPAPAPTTAAPYVIVSVAPHKFFVEKIAQKTVQVHLMVPAGASSHTYEPTPRQMLAAGQADLWFRIGEPFETRAMQALKSHRPSLEIIHLQEGLDLISTHGRCKCCPGAVDLHFWLSARQAQTQARTIAHTLMRKYPEHAKTYLTNLQAFEKELQELDHAIEIVLAPLKNRHIFVSHPAYGYFCRDYGLTQHSVEVEGKDPTPQQMTRLLQDGRTFGTRKIFIQTQYNNKGAKLVAETLNAELVTLDPYSEHFIASMWEIANAFASQ